MDQLGRVFTDDLRAEQSMVRAPDHELHHA